MKVYEEMVKVFLEILYVPSDPLLVEEKQ